MNEIVICLGSVPCTHNKVEELMYGDLASQSPVEQT